MRRLVPLVVLLTLLLVACARHVVPTDKPAPGKEPPDALTFAGDAPASLSLEYRVNGGTPVRTTVDQDRPWVEPQFSRALPAVEVEYRWLGPDDRLLEEGSRLYVGRLSAVEWQVDRGEHTVLFTGEGSYSIRVEDLDREYSRLIDLYGDSYGRVPKVIPVYIFPTKEEFARFSAVGDHAWGTAEGTFRAAYVLSVVNPATVLRVAVHEMAHLIGAIGFGLSWVNEGLAELAEEPFFSSEFDAYLNRLAQRTAQNGGMPDIGTLSGREKYEAGYLMFRYMRDRYGPETFRRFLSVARDEGIDQAWEPVFGKDRVAFEREFGTALLGRARGDESLWTGARP